MIKIPHRHPNCYAFVFSYNNTLAVPRPRESPLAALAASAPVRASSFGPAPSPDLHPAPSSAPSCSGAFGGGGVGRPRHRLALAGKTRGIVPCAVWGGGWAERALRIAPVSSRAAPESRSRDRRLRRLRLWLRQWLARRL